MAWTLLKAGVIYDERGPQAQPGDLGKTGCVLASKTFAVIIGCLTDAQGGQQRAWVINPTTGHVGEPIELPPNVIRTAAWEFRVEGVALDDDTILLVLNNSSSSNITGDTYVCTVTSTGVLTVLANPTLLGLMRGTLYRPGENDILVRLLVGAASGCTFWSYSLDDQTTASVTYTPPAGEMTPVLDAETIYARTALDQGILDRYTGAVRVPLDMTSNSFGNESASTSAAALRYSAGVTMAREAHIARINGAEVEYDFPFEYYEYSFTSYSSPEAADHFTTDVRAFEGLAVAAGGIWTRGAYTAESYQLYLQLHSEAGVEEVRHTWDLPYVLDGEYRGVDYYGVLTSERNGLVLAMFEGAVWGYDSEWADDHASMLGFTLWSQVTPPPPRVRVSFQRGRV